MANDFGRPPTGQLDKARRYGAAMAAGFTVIDGDKKADSEAREINYAAAAKKEAAEVLPGLPALSDVELGIFCRSLEVLFQENRYKRAYLDALWSYCKVVARIYALTEFLEDEGNGFVYKTYGRNGTQHKRRPEAVQLSEEYSRFNNLCAQFGFTPLAELRFDDSAPQGDLFGPGDNPFNQVSG